MCHTHGCPCLRRAQMVKNALSRLVSVLSVELPTAIKEWAEMQRSGGQEGCLCLDLVISA